MALKLYDTLNPSGDFPLVEAKDVSMPDGTRLSDLSIEPGIDEETEKRIAALETQDKVFIEAAESLVGRVDELEKSAASVDMTAFEESGVIVETYADGSTVTYTMEFDESGNPVKITDSKGNVTELVGFSAMGGVTYEAAEGVSF